MAAANLGIPLVDGRRVDVTGPVLFSRYAYPPNALGYCGPADPPALLACASEGRDLAELRHLAMQFEGAWPYLELIAGSNHISDPLDRRVVEAYWVGNPLTRNVPSTALANSLEERFRRRAGASFGSLVEAAPAGGIPHHNFHVFAVYPWLGLLRAGMDTAPLEVLDRCRIRWGRVEAVFGDWALVRSRFLAFDGFRLVLASERLEQVRHHQGGTGPEISIAPGDTVSMHWDWVCDRLTGPELGWLRYCTQRNLNAVNAQSVASRSTASVGRV